MSHGKPIIGIIGGIGSGKTYVARLFAELGCLVIEADSLVREAYEDLAVQKIIREWWAETVFKADGKIDRPAIARRIFNNTDDRKKLEALLHPWVNARRQELQKLAGPGVVAFIWDTPLLLETGLNRECDAVIFVDVPEAERLRRVTTQRGWDAAELHRREILQLPLDKKREISDYVLVNAAQPALDRDAEADDIRNQVRKILSRIVAGLSGGPEVA